MSRKRVVVTGIGAVTPLGPTRNKSGRNEFWDNIVAGRSAISDIEQLKGLEVFDRIKGAEIKGWDITKYFNNSEVSDKLFKRKRGLFDKMIQFALAATKLTLTDGNLLESDRENIGFYTGNGMQGIGSIEEMMVEITMKYTVGFAQFLVLLLSDFDELMLSNGQKRDQAELADAFKKLKEVFQEEIRELEEKGILDFLKVTPYEIFKQIPPTIFNFLNYAICGHVTQMFEFHGPALAVNSACSSGSDAIGQAYRVIQDGDAEVVVAGGTEAPIAYSIISMFNRLKVMSKNGVKPGDKERDGFALGEGAGYLVLEDLDRALEREAKIYSELVAYSQTNDGYSMVQLEPSGRQVVKAINRALEKAGLSPQEIDYINPHATSTKECDLIESDILRGVFSDRINEIIVHPTKCLTGHFQAGAGAVEAILINLIFQNNFIPGIPNQDNPEPNFIFSIPDRGIAKQIRTAMSTSLGFGGHNSVLIFRRYPNED